MAIIKVSKILLSTSFLVEFLIFLKIPIFGDVSILIFFVSNLGLGGSLSKDVLSDPLCSSNPSS